MNDKQFKDLLNLYIDNEITPEQREAFEREIARNSSRRALYEEYSWMQRASEVILKRFEGDVEGLPHLKNGETGVDSPFDKKKTAGDWRLFYGAAALFMVGGTLFLAIPSITNPPRQSADNTEPPYAVAASPSGNPSERVLESLLRGSKVPPILLPSDGPAFSWEDPEKFEFSLRKPVAPQTDSLNTKRVYSSRNFLEPPAPEMASFVFRR